MNRDSTSFELNISPDQVDYWFTVVNLIPLRLSLIRSTTQCDAPTATQRANKGIWSHSRHLSLTVPVRTPLCPYGIAAIPRGYGVSSSRLFKKSLKSAVWVASYNPIAQQNLLPETSIFFRSQDPNARNSCRRHGTTWVLESWVRPRARLPPRGYPPNPHVRV